MILCAVLEGGARLLNPQLPEWQGDGVGAVVMSGHPTRLWYMRPGIKQNHQTTASINQLGFRGNLPSIPRDPDRERIVVVGDSSFFGFGVGDNETFHVVLERLLQKRGIQADVINGAVPGYSIAQTKLWLEDIGWKLQPTLLVVANLWSDNNFDAFKDEDLLRSRRFANLNPLSHSAFMRWVASKMLGAIPGGRSRLVTWSPKSDWPDMRTRRVPLERYASLLDAVVRDGAEQGVGTTFIAPCNVESVQGQWEDAWTPYFEAMRQVARHHNTEVVELLGPFQQVAEEEGAEALFVDQMHPSVVGHRILAEAIAHTLKTRDWPNARLLGQPTAMDTSGLVDEAVAEPPESEENKGLNSVQKTLFAGNEGHFKKDGQEPQTQGRLPAEGAGNQPSEPTGAGWSMHGNIAASSGPVQLEVQSPEGQILARDRLNSPGPFQLSIPSNSDQVFLFVVGPDGTGTKQAVLRGANPVEVRLDQP